MGNIGETMTTVTVEIRETAGADEPQAGGTARPLLPSLQGRHVANCTLTTNCLAPVLCTISFFLRKV